MSSPLPEACETRAEAEVMSDFHQRMKRLPAVFPAWYKHQEIMGELTRLKQTRAKLLETQVKRGGPTSASMAKALMQTSALLEEINGFHDRAMRLKRGLTRKRNEAIELIHDLENAKEVQHRIEQKERENTVERDDSITSSPAYDWEEEEEEEEEEESLDEKAQEKGLDFEDLIKKVKAEAEEIEKRIAYHTYMDDNQQAHKRMFCEAVSMYEWELAEWWKPEEHIPRCPSDQVRDGVLQWCYDKFKELSIAPAEKYVKLETGGSANGVQEEQAAAALEASRQPSANAGLLALPYRLAHEKHDRVAGPSPKSQAQRHVGVDMSSRATSNYASRSTQTEQRSRSEEPHICTACARKYDSKTVY